MRVVKVIVTRLRNEFSKTSIATYIMMHAWIILFQVHWRNERVFRALPFWRERYRRGDFMTASYSTPSSRTRVKIGAEV